MYDCNARAAAALRRLHELGAIRSPWPERIAFNENAAPGMGLFRNGKGYVTVEGEAPHAATPDTTDALTVAAFGLLAREAWGGAPMSAVRERGAAWIIANGLCDSMLAGGRYFRGDTEADAWIAALEARVVALGG